MTLSPRKTAVSPLTPSKDGDKTQSSIQLSRRNDRSKIALFMLTCLSFVIYYMCSDLKTALLKVTASPPLPKVTASPIHVRARSRYGDGCYHIFLDVGANNGALGRVLLEPDLYPNATVAHHVFDKNFGTPDTRNNKDICVFAFEPNPNHVEKHQQMQTAYAKLGWRYQPVQAGVGNETTKLTFYHFDDANKDEPGFGPYTPGRGKNHIPTNVTIIRLSSWLTEHIEERVIPNSSVKSGGPKVVMKFDVEGMEFDLFPDLLATGALCRNIDYAFGEIHPFRWDGGKRKKVIALQNKLANWNAPDECKTKQIDTVVENYTQFQNSFFREEN